MTSRKCSSGSSPCSGQRASNEKRFAFAIALSSLTMHDSRNERRDALDASCERRRECKLHHSLESDSRNTFDVRPSWWRLSWLLRARRRR